MVGSTNGRHCTCENVHFWKHYIPDSCHICRKHTLEDALLDFSLVLLTRVRIVIYTSVFVHASVREKTKIRVPSSEYKQM